MCMNTIKSNLCRENLQLSLPVITILDFIDEVFKLQLVQPMGAQRIAAF